MIVEDYATVEADALQQISQYLSDKIATFKEILGPDYGDMHDNLDVARRGYEVSGRELRGLEETTRLGYSKIVWLRNEAGVTRCFRITPGPSMISDRNVYFSGSTVERYFGGQDVDIGETKTVGLDKGPGIFKREWTLVARAIIKNCQLNLQLPNKSDIEIILYENNELQFQLNKLRN